MKERRCFYNTHAYSPGIYHRGCFNTEQGIIVPQKPATGNCYTRHAGSRTFLLKCILQCILGHLVVSNGNNLIQLKKKMFIFNVVTILWHLFDKLLWSWAEARTNETSKHIFVLRCIHRDRGTDIVPCQNNPLVFLTHGIYVFLICFARV